MKQTKNRKENINHLKLTQPHVKQMNKILGTPLKSMQFNTISVTQYTVLEAN